MSPEDLFVAKLDDLQKLVHSNDDYEVLRSSAILRLLLIDGNSLIDKVNRNHKLKFEFRVRSIPPHLINFPENLKPDIQFLTIDPDAPHRIPLNKENEILNKDKFLAYPIAFMKSQNITVRHVIKFVANSEGGVHFGKSRSDMPEDIDELKNFFIGNNLNFLLSTLKVIGKIVLEATKSLKYLVQGIDKLDGIEGITLCLGCTLYPETDDRQNYITDIGVDRDKDRVTLFVNGLGELILRIFDSNGIKYVLKAGRSGFLYKYGEPMFLVCQIGFIEQRLIMWLQSDRGEQTEVFVTNSFQFSIKSFSSAVFGADIEGDGQANMKLSYVALFKKCYSKQNIENVIKDFRSNLDRGYLLQRNDFRHSKGHPNFDEDSNLALGNKASELR